MQKANIAHDPDFFKYLTDYENSLKKILIYCEWCGNVFKQNPGDHLKGKGCPSCGRKQTNLSAFKRMIKAKQNFIDKAKAVHRDYYDYSLVDYKGYKEKIKIKCNQCNSVFYQFPGNHLKGEGCSFCHTKRENYAAEFFKDKIKFERQYKFEDLRSGKGGNDYLKFDFYFPDKNILLEIDGEGHRKIINWCGDLKESEECFAQQRQYDFLKDEYCKKNNIKLFRIEYFSNNKQKLLKDLNTFLVDIC